MKRIIPLIFAAVVLLSACTRASQADSPFGNTQYYSVTSSVNEAESESSTRLKAENYVPTKADNTQEASNKNSENEEDFFTASWLSYIELSVKKGRETKEKYTAYIDGIFENMKKVNITDVFVQVRPFADAFYVSSLFPASAYAASEQGGELPFDVLSLITERAKEKNLNIHAWINPYRVSINNDINTLSKNNPAYLWYKEGETEDVVISDSGIYFNPASEKVRKLIVDGAKELLSEYDIKGIHIDDYFYFDGCGNFDKSQYESYTSQGGSLSLDNWRRENVNCLVSSLYIAVKEFGQDKIFSVSPSGDMNKCYEESYADVSLWCSEEGYCDIIIPQIYFGFENEKLPFEQCLSQWLSACKGKGSKLVIGLALYKAGQEDAYALSGKNEWIENSDVISRQVKLLKEKGCRGFGLYSGTYINFSETFLSQELHNLKSVL